jgi:putative copper resistance protein D
MSESLNVAALFAATILTIGACAAMWLVRSATVHAGRLDPEVVLRRLEAGAVAGALALCVLLSIRLITHALAVFGLPDGLTVESLRIVGLESRWGGGWRMQMIAALAALAGALWHLRVRRDSSRTVMSIAVSAFAFVLPLSGHSAGSSAHVAVAGAHVLGGGAWIGTLTLLLLLPREGADRPRARVELFQRFSPLAMVSVALVAATGLAMIWLYVESPLTVLSSGYGRLLAAKLALFAAVGIAGFLNWRRARLGQPPTAATWEVAFAAVLVIITGFLSQTSPP